MACKKSSELLKAAQETQCQEEAGIGQLAQVCAFNANFLPSFITEERKSIQKAGGKQRVSENILVVKHLWRANRTFRGSFDKEKLWQEQWIKAVERVP